MSEPEPSTEPATEPATEPGTEPEPSAPDAEPTPEEQEGEEQETGEPAETAIEPETPTPEAKAQQAEWEKRFKASERAVNAYANKIGQIFGDDAPDLIPCPMCPDMHKGFVNVHDAGRVPDEVKKAAMMFLGFAREIRYKQLPGYNTCATCDGEGKGETGSHVPDKKLDICPDCKGFGFRGPQRVAANGQVESAPILTGPLHTPDAPANDEVDEWQEPRILPDGRENPNFGRMPHRKIQVEPWGTTAGLTAQDAVTVE